MWLENERPEPDLDMLDAEERIMAEDLYNQRHVEDFDQRTEEERAAEARIAARHEELARSVGITPMSEAKAVALAQSQILRMLPGVELCNIRIRSRRSA